MRAPWPCAPARSPAGRATSGTPGRAVPPTHLLLVLQLDVGHVRVQAGLRRGWQGEQGCRWKGLHGRRRTRQARWRERRHRRARRNGHQHDFVARAQQVLGRPRGGKGRVLGAVIGNGDAGERAGRGGGGRSGRGHRAGRLGRARAVARGCVRATRGRTPVRKGGKGSFPKVQRRSLRVASPARRRRPESHHYPNPPPRPSPRAARGSLLHPLRQVCP